MLTAKNRALFTLLLLGSHLLRAQSGGSFSPDKAARIDSVLAIMANSQSFNGSVLIAEAGTIVYKRSNGYADIEHKILNGDTTHFNLASLSKPFTALAVLQLVQKKKLKLDDPLVTYFPDFPYAAVTIKNLLNHTSGLPQLEGYERKRVSENPDMIFTNEQCYADLLTLKPGIQFKPGDRWSYNNLNYLLLALLVQQQSKMPFAAYMKKFVFLPANMKNTYVRMPWSPNTPRYTRPATYFTDYKNVDSLDHVRYSTYYNLGSIQGPGNVVSTLQDLLLFDNALNNGKLIDTALLSAAFTPVTLNNGNVFHMGASTRTYGLGWSIYTSRVEPINKYVFHDGHIVGLTTMLQHNLTKNQTIIFYDNMDGNPFDKLVPLTSILNDQPVGKLYTAKSLARIYGKALIEKGADYAMAQFNTLKADSVNYYVDEMEINSLGYDLLFKPDATNHVELSIEAFKVNTILYPKSANAYDSYADALLKGGKKEEAALMYQKSLSLNPNNQNAKDNLRQLADNKTGK